MLEVSPELIHFGDVAVNDIPSYCPFKVRNTQPFSLTIQLSGVDELVRFQLQNENYTALTRGKGNYGTYEPIFDSVNVLSEFQLQAFEEKDIVVSFRATPETFTHASSQATSSYSRSLQLITTPTGRETSPPVTSTADGNKTLASPTSPNAALSESLSVPYQANVFVSQLEVSLSELQMTMGVNKTSIQSFTVTNTSCCPLSFVIRNQVMPQKGINIALYEAERLENPKLAHTLMIDSQTSINFALLVQTMTPVFGRHQAVLQCDNLRDGRNVALIYVNINVVAESQGELVTLSDSALNFGDVYRGTEARGNVEFQNVDGREEVTVAIVSGNKWKYPGSVKLLLDGLPVDEVIVPPQKGPVMVTIVYKPTFDHEHRESSKVKFDLELAAQSGTRQQRLTVRCAASLFTSSIAISHTNLNFGDCPVGQTKKYTFTVENQSPLPCSVIIQLRSKIISIDGVTARQNANERETRAKFSVGPMATLPVTLRIAPQRVNPTYRKQLTVVNASNPSEDIQVINIESNNMAPTEAKVHNELYSWECRAPSTDGDSNATNLHAVTNVPLLVPYLARSKVDRPLTLCIQTTSGEIEVLYAKDAEMADALDSVEAEMRAIAPYGDSMDSSSGNVAPDRVSQVRKELLKILSQGVVITGQVVLEPLGSLRVYALIIRTPFASEPLSKEDGLSISVPGVDIPRFVRLSYKLCSTSFILSGQKTKNFGEVNIGTRKNTKLQVVNRCKSTLFLCVSKSRSVTAGHIRLENSDKQAIFLCIRPYATKEVELLFFPGIKGVFEEKIHLTNVLDPQNDVVVTVKATVTKADTFEISPDSWSFGMVTVPGLDDLNQNARVGAKFIVSNTSKSRRQVGIRLDTNTTSGIQEEGQTGQAPRLRYQGIDVQIQMDFELSGASSGSTRKVEEQIEKLEQKIKIYIRKKKVEKLAAAQKRVEVLKRALLGEEVDLSAVDNSQTADPDFSESEDESSSASSAVRHRAQNNEALSLLLRDGMLLPTMNAGETVTLTVALVCTRVADQSLPALQANTINLLLYEAADQEITRIVPIDVIFTRPEGESGSPAVMTASGAASSPAPAIQQERASISLDCNGVGRAVSLFMGYPIVMLRNTIVNDHADFSFLVRADRKTSVVILEPKRCASPSAATLDARFKFFPRNGVVPEGEPLRIEVECTPRSVGPQKYFIAVKNLQNAVDVQYLVVELNPTEEEEFITTEPKLINFRDVVTPADPHRLESQLLLIRTRFPHTHLLLVRSNKPSQFVFFEDPQCRVPLRNPIQRTFARETVRVYVQYQPSPKSVKDSARVIRAGVVIEGVVQNSEGNLCTVGRVNVPLTVQVGGGHLLVPNPLVDLGTVSPSTTSVKTTVRIINSSDAFPIHGHFTTTSSACLSVVEGVSGELWTWSPREEKEITLTAHLPTPGLFKEYITLTNTSCSQEPICIGVTVLRQDETITAVFENGASVNTVLMPVGAVARGDDGSLQLFNTVSSSFLIRNSATKDVIVASKCSLPLSFGDGKPVSPSAATGGGGRLRLEARQSQKAEWHLVDVPSLTDEQMRSLLHHGSATVHAVAQIFVAQILSHGRHAYQQLFMGKRHLPSVEQCVLLVPFTVTLATSEGYASPVCADLGTVGGAAYNSRAKDGQSERERKASNSTVKIRLVNTSSYLPLQLGVVHDTAIRFQENRIVVPPGESRETEASLQLKRIPRQGPFHYEIFFVNELNPENEITVSVMGQYYWKIFQLSYNGNDGIQDSLSLPNLHVDCAGEASLILSEGKLSVSATEQNLQLGLRVAKNPDFEGLVELQLLHYDATSTVEQLIFSEDSGNAGSGGGGRGGGAGGHNTAHSPSNDANTAVTTTTTTATSTTAGGTASSAVTATSTSGGGPTAPGDNPGSAVAAGGGHSNPSGGSGPAGPGQSANAPSRKRQAVQLRSQTIRLRCVLLTNDLGAVASLFFGSRRKQLPDVWTFEKLIEYEKRQGRTGSGAPNATGGGGGTNAPGGATATANAAVTTATTAVSNNIWLGTVLFYNDLTDDEEIEVFGRLEAFNTFSVPNKMSLRPFRLDTRGNDGGGGALAASSSVVVYAGDLLVTNLCGSYTTELLVHPVLSQALSGSVAVELYGRVSDRASSPKPSTRLGATVPNGESMAEELASLADTVGGPLLTTSPSNLSSSPSRYVRIPPQETVTLNVVVRAVGGQSLQSVLQSSIEQQVALVVVDDAMPMNVSVARFSLIPFDTDDEQLPLITLANTTSSNGASTREDRTTPQDPNAVSGGSSPHDAAGVLSAGPPSSVPFPPPSSWFAGGGAGSSSVDADAAHPFGASALLDGVTLPSTPMPEGEAAALTSTTADADPACHTPFTPPLESTARHAALPGVADAAAKGTPLPTGSDGSPSSTTPAPLSTSTSLTIPPGLAEEVRLLRRATTAPGASLAALTTPNTMGGLRAGEAMAATGTGSGTTAASTFTASPSPPASSHHHHHTTTAATTPAPVGRTLSLTNCVAAPGITGGYSCNVTFPREEPSLPEIGIKNNLTDRAVEYTTAVVSQSPHTWILLLSTSGELAPGEVQPLRLSVVTTDVGSFAAYLAVYNSTTAAEVVYLRLTVDIYMPSTGESLFEFTSSSGSRVASNSTRMVKLGHFYGDNTHRAYIALEIANRSSGVLEFPVSVVKPFRLEMRPITAADTGHRYHATKHHHHHHHHHTHRQQSRQTPPVVASRASSGPDATEGSDATPLSVGKRVLKPTTAKAPVLSEPPAMPMLNPCLLVPSAATASRDRFILDAKLVVCHVHGVATRANQKYVVVDPRSRVRLVFVLSCMTLRVPPGFAVYGESDVVFKCKQARDANFTYKATFQAFPPTFIVEREIEVPYDDMALSRSATLVTSRRGSRPDRTEAGPLGFGEVCVHVHNLQPHAQTFVFRTQSPALYVTYTASGPGLEERQRVVAPSHGSSANSSVHTRSSSPQSSSSAGGLSGAGSGGSTVALLEVPANSSRCFVVRMDVARAAALLNYDKDDLGKQPSLCEHAHILNRGNPKERVAVQFRYTPPATQTASSPTGSASHMGNASSPLLNTGTPTGPVAAASSVGIGPLKSGGQHMAEQYVFSFAQRFTNSLAAVSDRMLALFAYYAASREMGVSANMGTAPVSAVSSRASATTSVSDRSSQRRSRSCSSSNSSSRSESSCSGSRSGSRGSAGSGHSDSSPPTRGRSRQTQRTTRAQSQRLSLTDVDDTATARPGAPLSGDISVNTSLISPPGEELTLEPTSPSLATSLIGSLDAIAAAVDEAPPRALPTTTTTTTTTAKSAVRRSRTSRTAADDQSRARRSGHGVVSTPHATPPSAGTGADEEARRLALSPSVWDNLHDLLVELTWLVDELLFFSILLRNSRMIDGYCLFITATVAYHPVMRAWRQNRYALPDTSEYRLFSQFIETLDLLPCATPSA